jgi:hypothetical protein
MITRRKLEKGELSVPQKVYQLIQEECGVDEESFYGNMSAAENHVFQHGNCGLDLIHGFLAGMRVMQGSLTVNG